MSGCITRLLRKCVLLEAGAAILFFGALIHQPQLARFGADAVRELEARGYRIFTASEPVRVYPAGGWDAIGPLHAGNWRPGVISLRVSPQGTAGPEVYLRHELMHEASFRTCEGRLPLWAEEAAAIDFSGELQPGASWGQPAESALAHLRARVRIGAPLDPAAYAALKQLVALYGWPREPCAVSERIAALATPPASPEETGFSYVLASLVSGRVLESQGDLEGKYPPGSLLKIPFAAALKTAEVEALGVELAASDTVRLMKRAGELDPERYALLLSAAGDTLLARSVSSGVLSGSDGKTLHRLLGERDPDGSFAFDADLQQIALMLRISLLSRPEYFAGLSANGFVEGSTLYGEPGREKKILADLHAIAKTGTVSDQRGSPLVGHLMVAWPAELPVFLAVFRGLGGTGASCLKRASKVLEEWNSRFPPSFGKVRVSLLGLTPRSTWEAFGQCAGLERDSGSGWRERVSVCGGFRLVSTAKGSRSERYVSGILAESPSGRQTVLETDPESYAEAVLSAEAQGLPAEARDALRAVIVWNGARGGGRHPETSSVCDTTHCMVFPGESEGKKLRAGRRTGPGLLQTLDVIAGAKQLEWLPFSKGGSERWEKRVPAAELSRLLDELAILDIRRERLRTGEVSVHLFYRESEEVVPCEVFRNRLKLPSCPDSIQHDEDGGGWTFKGTGEGHGLGLSVERAAELAEAGLGAAEILADAYK